MAPVAPIGFIGLGSMGEPMALNLVKAGMPLVVWNRSLSKCQPLADAGALVAKEAADVFAQCDVIFLMLADHAAIDEVLERNTDAFADRVGSRVIVNTSTVLPSYSEALEADIRAAGGRYVEAPVSGSRKPAEAGQLVAMLSGDAADVESVRPLFKAMCRDTFLCGDVPGALKMKLAVNLFLITMVTGLAEATHFAERLGLNLARFVSILDAGLDGERCVTDQGGETVGAEFRASGRNNRRSEEQQSRCRNSPGSRHRIAAAGCVSCAVRRDTSARPRRGRHGCRHPGHGAKNCFDRNKPGHLN